MCTVACMWSPKDSLWELAVFLHHILWKSNVCSWPQSHLSSFSLSGFQRRIGHGKSVCGKSSIDTCLWRFFCICLVLPGWRMQPMFWEWQFPPSLMEGNSVEIGNQVCGAPNCCWDPSCNCSWQTVLNIACVALSHLPSHCCMLPFLTCVGEGTVEGHSIVPAWKSSRKNFDCFFFPTCFWLSQCTSCSSRTQFSNGSCGEGC